MPEDKVFPSLDAWAQSLRDELMRHRLREHEFTDSRFDAMALHLEADIARVRADMEAQQRAARDEDEDEG